MVLVNLKKDWFGPDGSLYQSRDNPHEFPDSWADKPAKEAERSKFAVLPSTAEVVKGSRTVATLQQTANETELVVPTTVEDDVKSVGAALDSKGVEQPTQPVPQAAKAAEERNLEVGGKPRESGPLPAGTKDKK